MPIPHEESQYQVQALKADHEARKIRRERIDKLTIAAMGVLQTPLERAYLGGSVTEMKQAAGNCVTLARLVLNAIDDRYPPANGRINE